MPTDTTPDVAASLLDLAERVSQLEAGLRQLREPTPDTSGVDLNDIASIWYGDQRFAVGTVVLFHPVRLKGGGFVCEGCVVTAFEGER